MSTLPEDEINAELEKLRARQAKKVMKVIGPLLDEWDALPNDVASVRELKAFGRLMGRLFRAVES